MLKKQIVNMNYWLLKKNGKECEYFYTLREYILRVRILYFNRFLLVTKMYFLTFSREHPQQIINPQKYFSEYFYHPLKLECVIFSFYLHREWNHFRSANKIYWAKQAMYKNLQLDIKELEILIINKFSITNKLTNYFKF